MSHGCVQQNVTLLNGFAIIVSIRATMFGGITFLGKPKKPLDSLVTPQIIRLVPNIWKRKCLTLLRTSQAILMAISPKIITIMR